MSTRTPVAADMDFDMLLFLSAKPRPRLIGATCCHVKTFGPDGELTTERCVRPRWGDGRVDGDWYGYCSAHWHEYNAFHGRYLTMQANPAAAKLDGTGIRRLTFGSTGPTSSLDSPAGAASDHWLPADIDWDRLDFAGE